MYLKKTKRNGRTYLSAAKSYRADGKVKTKIVESFGYVDELALDYDDPIAHFENYICELNARNRNAATTVNFSIAHESKIPTATNSSVQYGSAISLAYLDALGVGEFFSHNKVEGRVFELLTSARMMHAVPMHDTWSAKEKLPKKCGFSFRQVYESFELFASCAELLVNALNSRYERIRGPRNLSEIRLVFSNYVFKGGVGSDISGAAAGDSGSMLRFCLAIDADGMPISYRLVSRDLPMAGIAELVDSLKMETGAEKVTLVAAQVAEPEATMNWLSSSGNGFVFLLPMENAPDDLRRWDAETRECAVTRNGQYRIKSRMAGEGVPVKQIVLSKTSSGGSSGGSSSRLSIEPSSGGPSFYIVSSELTHSDASIFNIYRELWRVHEPFQMITADFIAPPSLVSASDQIKAHFLICYTAFFALRVLRRDMGWSHNAATVADALVNLEGAYLDENWYIFNYRTEVTDAIEIAAGSAVAQRIMSRRDISSAIAKMRKHIARLD